MPPATRLSRLQPGPVGHRGPVCPRGDGLMAEPSGEAAGAISTHRAEAFSDGVFAVAITLLVFNIAVPVVRTGGLQTALSNEWPSYASYAVSFLTIGIIWVNHHA